MPVRFRIKVNAKPEDVFAYVSDVGRHSEWCNPSSKLKTEAVSGGPVAVGSTFRSTQTFVGKPVTADIAVTRCQPPSSFGFTATQHTPKRDDVFVNEFTFTPQDGGTLVERSLDRPGAPAAAKIVGMLAYPAIRADAMKALRNLKKRLERG